MFSRFLHRYKKVHPLTRALAYNIDAEPPPPVAACENGGGIIIPEENVSILHSVLTQYSDVDSMKVLIPTEIVYYDGVILFGEKHLPFNPNRNFHWMNNSYLIPFSNYSVFIIYPDTHTDYQYQIIPFVDLFTFIAIDENNHKLHTALENIVIEMHFMYDDAHDYCRNVLLNMMSDLINCNCGVNIKIIKISPTHFDLNAIMRAV